MATTSHLRESRHVRTTSLGIDPPDEGSGSPVPSLIHTRFEGARSPPNTSHVPCKFFRQNACQAGNACPFSHDIGAASETICKYFAKGNCKFGPKCANIHVLPNGRRINYHKNGITIGAAPVALTGRASPAAAPIPFSPPSSALTTGLYGDSQNGLYSAMPSQYGPYGQSLDERQQQHQHQQHQQHQHQHQTGLEGQMAPTFDSAYSGTGSVYGSPRDDDTAVRLGMFLSPIGRGVSALDAPLPASFDSDGISNAARFPAGPFPSSMPSKFGLDSPSPSLALAQDMAPSDALKMLHTSAFGGSDFLAPPAPHFSSSPPTNPVPIGDEMYERKRLLHSSRFSKPRMLSSSLPRTVDRDWDDEFSLAEEDCLPQNLQHLLTPAEKARRGSMRDDGGGGGGGAGSSGGDAGSSRYGSPAGSGASPGGRWNSHPFQRRGGGGGDDDSDSSPRPSKYPSTFEHIGSPLRNSSLAHEMGSDTNGHHHHIHHHLLASHPSPSLRAGTDSLSALSQQLQRSRLSDDGGSIIGTTPHLHPSSAARNIGVIGRERAAVERHASNGSSGAGAGAGAGMGSRFATPIDEEDNAFVFNMDEDEPVRERLKKRTSSGLGSGNSVWSYATVAAGRGPAAPTAASATAGPKRGIAPEPIGGR